MTAACAGAPAGASAGGNPLGLEVEIVETSQSRILADDALKLRVSADTRVDASLRVRTTGGKPLAKRLEVRAKPNPKVHKLPLTQRGANRLARCKPRELEASATAIFEGDIIIRTEDRRALVTDSPACEPPPTRAYGIEPGGPRRIRMEPPAT